MPKHDRNLSMGRCYSPYQTTVPIKLRSKPCISWTSSRHRGLVRSTTYVESKSAYFLSFQIEILVIFLKPENDIYLFTTLKLIRILMA